MLRPSFRRNPWIFLRSVLKDAYTNDDDCRCAAFPQSCPGCRLNLQPHLRKYLHEEVKPGKIPGVTIEL